MLVSRFVLHRLLAGCVLCLVLFPSFAANAGTAAKPASPFTKQQLKDAGVPEHQTWTPKDHFVMPRPSYPYEAVAKNEQGTVSYIIKTDAAGNVSKVITQKDSPWPELSRHGAKWIVLHWHGPPNAAWTESLTWELHGSLAPEPYRDSRSASW